MCIGVPLDHNVLLHSLEESRSEPLQHSNIVIDKGQANAEVGIEAILKEDGDNTKKRKRKETAFFDPNVDGLNDTGRKKHPNHTKVKI